MQLLFDDLVEDQFNFAGSSKYQHDNEREVSDILVDDFGWNGLLYTIGKYVFRFKNTRREKDLLKIATYMFIVWLKLGKHLSEEEILEIDGYINTTVGVKQRYFPVFLERLASYKHNEYIKSLGPDPHAQLYNRITNLREGFARYEFEIFDIYLQCENMWQMAGFDKLQVHDTDTKSKG